MAEISFARVPLYEEVWTTPLTTLSRKYGLSDYGLRKVCKAMAIPLPSSGHWAKVAAGRAVPPTPLPNDAVRTTFVSCEGNTSQPNALQEDEDWLLERIAFEELDGNRLCLNPTVTRWHKAVAPLRDALRVAVREAEVARREAERAEKHPERRREPNWSGWSWGSYRDRGQILLHTHKSSPARVSPLTQERAMRIFDTLSKSAENRGFSVSLNHTRGRLLFVGHGGELELRISERLDEKLRTEKNSWDNKPRTVEYKVPTGRLRLFISWRLSSVEIADEGNVPIEERLNEVFIKCYRLVVRQREERRKSEARDREWQIQASLRRAEAERLAEEERLNAEERRRRRGLLVEAKNWKAAELIRDYVSHIISATTTDPTKDAVAWTDWATSVAQSLDPTHARQIALQQIGIHEL